MKQIVAFLILVVTSTGIYAQGQFNASYPDSINRKKLNTTIGVEVGSYLTGLVFLNNIWYKDHERVPFHFYNDSKGYLQMDKFGHAFGAYRESYSAYYALRKSGVSKKKALIYGGPIGLIFQILLRMQKIQLVSAQAMPLQHDLLNLRIRKRLQLDNVAEIIVHRQGFT